MMRYIQNLLFIQQSGFTDFFEVVTTLNWKSTTIKHTFFKHSFLNVVYSFFENDFPSNISI